MFLSIDQPVSYSLIRHLVSIIEEENTTEGVFLNSQPAKKLLTRDGREKLNFSDVRTFVRYVKVAPREVYNLVIRLQKHLVLVDKQNCKLKTKFTNYEKPNESYIVDNE